VIVQVQSVGLKKVNLVTDEGQTPKVTILEVMDDHGGRYINYLLEQRRPEGLVGQWVGPGEIVRCLELFQLRLPPENQVGWIIEFSFDLRRPIIRWSSLTWSATTFVPFGGYVSAPEYNDDGDLNETPDQTVDPGRTGIGGAETPFGNG
jgi:hypothetical protein